MGIPENLDPTIANEVHEVLALLDKSKLEVMQFTELLAMNGFTHEHDSGIVYDQAWRSTSGFVSLSSTHLLAGLKVIRCYYAPADRSPNVLLVDDGICISGTKLPDSDLASIREVRAKEVRFVAGLSDVERRVLEALADLMQPLLDLRLEMPLIELAREDVSADELDVEVLMALEEVLRIEMDDRTLRDEGIETLGDLFEFAKKASGRGRGPAESTR